jgi:TM2 domain-containing membrane protein YozV
LRNSPTIRQESREFIAIFREENQLVTTSATQPTVSATAAPVAAAPVFPPITQAPLKDVGITYILLIIFGAIGVHKFYLGRIGLGIAYIFTGGLFGIGLIVDIFTLTTQVRKANAKVASRGF